MAKFVHTCTCGGTIVARKMVGREYVSRADVYEVPSEMVLDTCDRCKDVWLYLHNKRQIAEIVKHRPIRTMSKEEHDQFWDSYLVKRGSTPLYGKVSIKA